MSIGQERWTTVSQLTTQIKKTLELDRGLQNVWLRAEISNFKRHSRGHMYFTLKDERSRISAVMFAGKNRFLNFEPENGMKVLIRGYVSVYEPFGQYQLYVNDMEPDGIGQLYIQYEQLKKKLEQEGLFDERRKQAIPFFPKEIAVITSPTGAAIRDIVTTLKRRFPIGRITLFPVLVQGRDAPYSIVSALDKVESMGSFDVVICGRGGGSIEELWAFNEEPVARKIASLPIPIISAVGHETDFTIADFTADLRAATPTAAAELAVPVLEEIVTRQGQLKNRLYRAMKEKVAKEQEKLARMKRSYAFRYPTHLLEQKEQELDRMIERLSQSVKRSREKREEQLNYMYKRLLQFHPAQRVEAEKRNLEHVIEKAEKTMERLVGDRKNNFSHVLQKLQLLNPLEVIQRGYSVVYNEEKGLVKSIQEIEKDEDLTVFVQDGTIHATVKETSENTFRERVERGGSRD
ncbi:exodeoxyribonuclease VII large subunit [Alteribacillus iranensis]|uniref:Exodeoxyribonuclease 7 large subunit n=1 Tax=Alteribacillus iranensis TaxID=930128 RepID=A0A1I1ZHK1_9BACI|nr:exodeoxyribonuclease VII large subunit [Alteribacillus iranensis]SFE31167.1 Exodeoxyribonuclease VII large subunit [Alteribacillus iranensis]